MEKGGHLLNSQMLFEYGKKLESEGNYKEALYYFREASKAGSIEAKKRLRKIEKEREEKMIMEVKQKKKKRRVIFLVSLTTFSLLTFLIITGKIQAGFKGITKYTANISLDIFNFKKDSNTISRESLSVKNPITNETGVTRVYKKDELLFLTVYNALENYYAQRGEYPDEITDLIQKNPENWISFLPKDMVYKKTEDSYTLEYKNMNETFAERTTFKLKFYPETNEIAFLSGEQTLALYPVASGSVSLPFNESRVLARVVEPNGKGSSLGSRGFELENEIAIHGTNNPNSIGSRITAGSFRMYNLDIEILYPYVSLGTPFEISIGKPDKPMYNVGLPTLHDETIPFENETVPSKIYKWKDEY